MKVTKWETLYHEYHGATLKHKCGKRIVALSLLSFSLIFFIFLYIFFYFLFGSFSFFMASFFLFLFFVRSLIPTCGGIIVSIILSSLGQWSNNDDHHTIIFLTTQQLQLDAYNKIWLYMNGSGGVPGYAMNQEWHVWKNYEWWLCHKYDVHYMIMLSNMTMMECVIINGTVESCMEIYLGMAMEMP